MGKIEMAAKKKVTRKKTAKKKTAKKVAKRTKKQMEVAAAILTNVPTELEYHYLKVKSYRNVHGDGFFGGITTRGLIHMAVYSERRPIPKKAYYPVLGADGKGLFLDKEDETKRIGLEGVIRELEVGIFFDLPAAIELRKWLNDKIDALEKGENK